VTEVQPETVLRLFGRQREERTVGALLDGACAGSGSALISRGEAGRGKTRLLIEAQQFARAQTIRSPAGTWLSSRLHRLMPWRRRRCSTGSRRK